MNKNDPQHPHEHHDGYSGMWTFSDYKSLRVKRKLLTSLTATESETHVKVMSHDCTTSAGLFPRNAPALENSLV